MQYEQHATDARITLTPSVRARGAVIWLHGLGADGWDFVPLVEELQLPDTLPLRFIFPHAAVRSITMNNGYAMRAWYDIRTLREIDEDEAGIRDSDRIVRELVQEEVERGVRSDRIVLAGFSQGGALALYSALRHPRRLAGVLALSTYLPLAGSTEAQAHAANKATPIFMCHGVHDDVVPLQVGERSRRVLEELGYSVQWRTYPMGHEVTREELDDIRAWLLERFP
jgi:phospholipase/carboxylesterase